MAMARWSTFVLLLISGTQCGLLAAESLATLAPAETALFAEIPSPESTWQAYEASELAARWKQTRLAEQWLHSPFVKRWRKLDEHATARTGQTLTHHLRRLFADGVAVAVVLRDRTPNGILIARAAAPEHVTEAIRIWDKLEPPLRTEVRLHQGRSYSARIVKKPDGEQRAYYAVDGPRFLLSDQETLVQDCLQLWSSSADSNEPHQPSLADQPEFAELQLAAAPTAMLYVAPKRWLPILETLSDDKPPSQLILAGLGKLRGVLAKVVLDQGASAEIIASLDPAALTTDWRDFVARARQTPSVIDAAPAESLLVAGACLDARPLIAGFVQLLPEHDRRELQTVGTVLKTLLLGTDPWVVALPTLLSDWGGYIVLRPVTDQTPPRSHPFVAVLSSRLPESMTAEARFGLENALAFGVNAIAATMASEKNRPAITLQHQQQEASQDWRISGRPWGEMALRIAPDSITLSTSATELERSPERSAAAGQLQQALAQRFPNPAAFIWLNMRQYRGSLAPIVLQAIAGGKEPPPLAVLNELSKLFDDAFAAVTIEEQRIRLSAGGRIDHAR